MWPQEDQATAIGNMHKKFGEDRKCSSKDVIADRQTHRQTYRQDTLITILRSPIGGRVYMLLAVQFFKYGMEQGFTSHSTLK